jgi:hypothetical protein
VTCASGTSQVTHRLQQLTKLHGWYSLSTDGAVKGIDGLTGCGGLVREENGFWVRGFRGILVLHQLIWPNYGVSMNV